MENNVTASGDFGAFDNLGAFQDNSQERGGRISRTTLSDKTSRLRPRLVVHLRSHHIPNALSPAFASKSYH